MAETTPQKPVAKITLTVEIFEGGDYRMGGITYSTGSKLRDVRKYMLPLHAALVCVAAGEAGAAMMDAYEKDKS